MSCREIVDMLEKATNQKRKERPLFRADYWIEQYSKEQVPPPAEDKVLNPTAPRYDRNKLRAQQIIAYKLVPVLGLTEERRNTVAKLEEKLLRLENYLYSITVALRLVRDDDIARVLSDPEGVTRGICAFIGIEFDPELLRLPQIGSSSERDRPEKRGINRARAGSWQEGGLTRTEVFLCQKITGNDMKRGVYAAAKIQPSPLGLAYGLASFPFKLTLAFLLNLGRMRSIAQTIKRRL